MKNRKVTTLALAAACFSMVLGLATSCGPKGEVYDPNRVQIDVWNTFSGPQQNAFENIINNFKKIIKKNEGVDVVVNNVRQGNYNALRDQISNDFNLGKTPTIAVAYPDHVAHFMHKEPNPGDYMVNLLPLMTDPEIGFTAERDLCYADQNDFVEAFYDEGTHYVRDGVYSLPFEKSTELLFYNVDKLEQILFDWKGKQINATSYMNTVKYGEFMSLLEYINTNHGKYYIDAKGDPLPEGQYHTLFYDSDANMFITQSYQRDIPYIDLKDGAGQVLFNNEESVKMALEFRELYKKGILLTKNTNNQGRASDDFKNQKCLFIVGSSGGAAYNDVEGAFNVGVCKVPVFQEKDPTTGEYKDIPVERQKYVSQGVTLALFKNPAHSKELSDQKIKYGWKFMKYLTNTNNSIDMCMESNGYVPARKSSYAVPKYRTWLTKSGYMSKCANIVIKQIDGKYFNYPVFPGSDKTREKVGLLVDQVLRLPDENVETKTKALFTTYENEAKLALGKKK